MSVCFPVSVFRTSCPILNVQVGDVLEKKQLQVLPIASRWDRLTDERKDGTEGCLLIGQAASAVMVAHRAKSHTLL